MATPGLDAELAARETALFSSTGAAPYAATIVDRVVKEISPCVLVLPTGAGKSTSIPYAFVQAGYRVMIAEPTVAMAANVVSSFKAMFPSVRVGKAYGREPDIPKDARLIVCSNGYLKNRLLGTITTGGTCMSIEFTDIIMLDEVHMGMRDTHIIVSMWYYCTDKFAATIRMPRLVLSSATVGDLLVSRRFSPCVVLPPEKFTTPFEISEQWAEKDYGLQAPERYKAMGLLLRALHESRPVTERILLFVPGKKEMAMVIQASGLRDRVDVDFVMIRSESTSEDYETVKRAVDPLRLVVLATPSGDAGLTVTKLVHVIDSLIVKNNQLQSNGDTSLQPEFASQQLSRQRRGRVGRMTPGVYYPMCTQAFFESKAMPANYIPEIYRLPLYDTIIELVSHGIPAEETLAIYELPDLEKSITDLLRWGFIKRSPMSGELLTSSGGTFMTRSEIRIPQLAGVLYAWVRLGHPVHEGVILIQLISGFTSQMFQIPSSFETRPGDPRGQMEKMRTAFIRKHYGRFLGPSDVHTAIRIWNAIIVETMQSTHISAVQQWCTANAIQWRAVNTTIKNIQGTFPRIVAEAKRFDTLAAVEAGLDPAANAKTYDMNAITVVDEERALPILRRLMEHIYQDRIATLGKGGRAVFVARDGTTLEPSRTAAFTLQADPDSATPYPARIVVIARRSMQGGKTAMDQFLDVDDPNKIAAITTDELNTKLGIFLNRGVGSFAAIPRIRSKKR